MSFRQLFRRFFAPTRSGEHAGAGEQSLEQRSFYRYSVEFPVVVSGNDSDKQPFTEKSVLQDVSASGAMFLSGFPRRYHPGQILQISILLNPADDVRARIKNEATVVRVDQPAGDASDSAGKIWGVAVEFHSSFDFERIDPDQNGESG
ncbi:MAG: PilZ domain-containing protein [Desulfobacterales bacterium]|nr:PilZ domain-containing protein [Desulfobacterales bacterium]